MALAISRNRGGLDIISTPRMLLELPEAYDDSIEGCAQSVDRALPLQSYTNLSESAIFASVKVWWALHETCT